MLTALRGAVRAAMADLPVSRLPALRRANDPEALLATDLPQVTDATEIFLSRAAAQGWKVWEKGGWLLIDAPLPTPQAEPTHLETGELACCLSLLARHPEGAASPAEIRAIVKASEQGAPALERLCGRFHGEWAAALRRHESLPGGLTAWLCQAQHVEKVASPLFDTLKSPWATNESCGFIAFRTAKPKGGR